MLGGTREISREDREEGFVAPAFIGSESTGSCFKAAMVSRGGIDSKNLGTGASFLSTEMQRTEHWSSTAAFDRQHGAERLGKGRDEGKENPRVTVSF